MLRLCLPLLTLLLLTSAALAADYPPQDHGGGDLLLNHGDVIWGMHSNVGAFHVPTTATVLIKYYHPDDPGTGHVEIHAEHILVEGTLDAAESGYTGAEGFAGLRGPGTNGAGRYKQPDGTEFVGGQDRPPAGATDRDESLTLLMGRGGIGGQAAGTDRLFENANGGSGGGSGGGGFVKLFAQDMLQISGTITTEPRRRGQNGQDAALGGSGGSTEPNEIGVGGKSQHGCYVEQFPFPHLKCGEGSWGDSGDLGFGGGILVYSNTPGGLNISQGTFKSASRGCNFPPCNNAGTVKIFYRGEKPIGAKINTAHVFYVDLAILENENSGWFMR